MEKLGKLMLYDSTLSNPPGYACGSCHVAETGYTGPNSEINAFSGPQPGVWAYNPLLTNLPGLGTPARSQYQSAIRSQKSASITTRLSTSRPST